MSNAVRSRAIFYIGGYDRKTPENFYDRLDKEFGRFEKLWEVDVKAQQAKALNADVTQRAFTSNGDEWQVETDFHFFSVDDVVQTDFGRSVASRLWRYVVTSADYTFTGTGLAFLRHAWRFFLYFTYPLMAALFCVAIAILLANTVASLSIPFATVFALITFAAVLWGLRQTLWKKFYVLHLMDLWSFSRDYLRQNRDDIETKLDRYAQLMVERLNAKSYDEVLFIGHSTGGALILDAVGRAVEIDNDLPSRAKSFCVLTVGSTALKIGLHPAAGWFRDRLKALFSNSNVNWVEYQCLTDAINFFNTDPANLMRIPQPDDGRELPIVQEVRVKSMLQKETYERIRRNPFRVHYQFVFGNTRKHHYDFPAICLGPETVVTRANNLGAFESTLQLPKEQTA